MAEQKDKKGFDASKMMAPLMGIIMIGVMSNVMSGMITNNTNNDTGGNTTPTAYTCPYGDNLTFATLSELQNHVATVHPGMPIPVEIIWS